MAHVTAIVTTIVIIMKVIIIIITIFVIITIVLIIITRIIVTIIFIITITISNHHNSNERSGPGPNTFTEAPIERGRAGMEPSTLNHKGLGLRGFRVFLKKKRPFFGLAESKSGFPLDLGFRV